MAVASIAIGLAAAIISFLIMEGFQSAVKEKIYSFSNHLLITKFTMNNAVAEQPFDFHIDLYQHPEKFPFIKHVQEYSHKAGLIKTESEVLGIVFKGVGKSFNISAFRENIVEGKFVSFPDSGFSREIVLSRVIANKINAKVGDDIVLHFFQNPPRFRKLKIVGIYETNLSEYFDSKVVIGDLRLVQQLNGWENNQAGGIEVLIDFNYFNELWDSNFDFEQLALNEAQREIGESMDYDLNIETVQEKYVQVFEWLNLVKRQVRILLGIILTVVSVNMISVILILVMERIPMIGLLKAIGSTNGLIRSVFVFNGMNLILKGLIYGNVMGLGLCFLQSQFKLVKLNPHDYYMSYVPIQWNWGTVLILNLIVFAVVSAVLLLPTRFITRIQPVKAIRFD